MELVNLLFGKLHLTGHILEKYPAVESDILGEIEHETLKILEN